MIYGRYPGTNRSATLHNKVYNPIPESVQVSDRKGELEILPVSLGDDWRLSRFPVKGKYTYV